MEIDKYYKEVISCFEKEMEEFHKLNDSTEKLDAEAYMSAFDSINHAIRQRDKAYANLITMRDKNLEGMKHRWKKVLKNIK